MQKHFILFFAALITLAANAQESDKSKQTGSGKEQANLTEQLAKKWYLKRKESSENLPSDAGEGTYLDMKKSGDYEALLVKVEKVGEMLLFDTKEAGTWSLNAKKQTLTLVSGKQVIEWDIKNINDRELVLVKKENKAVWTFSDKE